MRIVFMGTSAFAVPFLEKLVEDHEVIRVVTAPDRPRGRGKLMMPCPVAERSRDLGIATSCPEDPRDIAAEICSERFDFLVTVAYGKKVPPILLDAPEKESLNVHASLLPALRGAAPITRAIEKGHGMTGLSVMRMVDKMDAGPVFTQREVPIAASETRGSLTAKLMDEGPDFLVETMGKIAKAGLEPREQDESAATWAKRLTRGEERIDFSLPAEKLERKIRAFAPAPGLRTFVRGRMLKVLAADCVGEAVATPGTVVTHSESEVVVACGEGALSLRHVQLAGKRPMDIAPFLRGAGRKLFEEGLVLGGEKPSDND